MQLNLSGLLAKNRPLANLHAGKRCFILGSGPSINGQNLLAIKDDVKVAVGWFQKHPDCVALNPQYWMVADPDSWKRAKEFLEPLVTFMLEQPFRPKLFLPTSAVDYMGALPAAAFLDLHMFHYDRARTLQEPLDFASTIPSIGQNVIAPGLMLALYLGCNPIYTLGCDHDWWAWSRQEYKQKHLPHFFNANKTDEIVEKHSFDDLQRTIRIQKYEYSVLRSYAESRGITIYNATKGGALESFQRADYDSLWFPQNAHKAAAPIEFASSCANGALAMLNDGNNIAALALIERASFENQGHTTQVEGLDYLRAICLARLSRHDEAMVAAQSSLQREPHLISKAEVLLAQLRQQLLAEAPITR